MSVDAPDPLGQEPYLRAVALHQDEEYEAALAAYDEAVAAAPDRARIHANRSSTLLALGRLDEAAEAATRAVALDPEDAYTHFRAGRVHEEAGREAEALAAFQRATEIEPEYEDAWYHLGELLALEGDADALIERAEALQDAAQAAWMQAAVALREQDRDEEAAQALARAAALDRGP